MNVMRRVFILGLLVCLVMVGSASAFLAGYGYYQDMTVNNGGASNLTDYQVMFVVNTSSGTSTSTTIYLNSHSEADLDDLRFTSTGDTVYDYWIESTSNPYNVWVEVPSIPTGNSTVRVQYGNAAASAASNGTATFMLFDTCLDSSLNTGIWTARTGSWSEPATGLYESGNSGGWDRIHGGNTSWTDYEVSADVYGASTYPAFVIRSSGATDDTNIIYYWYNGNNYRYYDNLEGGTAKGGTGYTPGNWNRYSVQIIGSAVIAKKDGVQIFTDTITGHASGRIGLANFKTAATYFKNTRVRNIAATEPTVPAWSGESTTAAAPVAAFSANRTTGSPGDVAFTDSSTNTPTSWAWSFDDGGPNSTDQNPVHTFAAGTYTIILTATNAIGSDSEEKIDYITLTDAPVAAFHANTTSGYAPLSVLFTDDSTNTPTSWVWEWGDGTANGTTQNPNHTYNTSGTYNVTLTATNAGGSDGETKLAYISVYSLVAFPGCASVPTDLDADGLYEDINGNTRKDWSDIILFFKYRIWAAANEPPAAFDFNGNGIIDYKDVLMLYDEGV